MHPIRDPRPTLAGAVMAILALAASGCASPLDLVGFQDLEADEVLFLALSEPPNAHMEALYQGVVRADQAGCVRLEESGSTVVWPYGATLAERNGALAVVDVAGKEIGRLGGAFSFGGGHVQALHEGIALSAADRQAAEERCPGPFWIVGEIAEP